VFNIFKPVNRHMTVIPLYQSKKKTQVLLPEDFEEKDRYIQARVLEVAPDCATCFKKMKHETVDPTIVIDSTMIEEIELNDKKHYLILENYVLGILKDRP
tara:strand:- start:671 stop:970 length:300 start_codon:yes stop_codon:yes gene_type:complete